MISWDTLDELTAPEIAGLLVTHGIKGDREKYNSCPLAVATGWCIDAMMRYQGDPEDDPDEGIIMTEEQQKFVEDFDAGLYPELD